MTQRQIAIRIGLDGKSDIQRDLNDIAASGDAAFGNLGKALDQGTAAIQRQKDATDRLVASQANVAAQAANQSKFNQVLGVGSANAAANGAPGSAYASMFAGIDQRAAAVRAQLDPLTAAQGKMNDAIADANVLLASGAISEAEHAGAVGLARKAYADAEGALKNLNGTTGLGSAQQMALTAAIRHMIDATIAGRPPLQSLAMESGNLSFALGGSGGVMGAIKSVASGIGGLLLSPLGLAAGAFAIVGGAAVLGFSRAQEAEKQFTESTNLAGRAAGLTRAQFDGIAQSAAAADNISVNVARGIEAAFVQTGAVGGKSLSGLIDLTDTFAKKTNQNLDAAGDALAKAFADPAGAGEKLLASIGGLDDKTSHLISTLMSQNDVTRAQQVLQDALTKTLKDATDQTTWYGDAWKWVKDQASGAVEALSHGFASSPDQAALANLKAQLAGAQKDNPVSAAFPDGYRAAEIAAIKATIAPIQARVDAANQKADLGAADAAAAKLSNSAGPLIRSAIPGLNDEEGLANAKKVLDQLNGNDAAMGKLGATTDQVAQAQDAYNHAVTSYIDPASKAAQINQLEIAALTAKTPAQKAAIAAQRERLDLAGKVITSGQAEAKVQQASALAYAQAKAAIDKHTDSLKADLAVADAYLKGSGAGLTAELGGNKLDEQLGKAAIGGAKQVSQLRDETNARKALNDQVAAGVLSTEQASQQLQIETTLAPLQIAYDLAQGAAKAELGKIIAALTAARAKDNDEANRSRALTELENSNRNLDLLKQELQISNDNESARQVELAVLQEKQRLLARNIDAESNEGKQLIANAAAAESLKQQLDLAAASRGEIENMFDDVSGKLSDLIVNGGSFKDVMLSAMKDVEAEGLKLSIINPAKNAIFGTNLPDSTSVGSALNSLIGGKRDGSSVQSALYVQMAGGTGIFGGTGANDNSNVLSMIFGSGIKSADGVQGVDVTPSPVTGEFSDKLQSVLNQSGQNIGTSISNAFSSGTGGGGFLSRLGSTLSDAWNDLSSILSSSGGGSSDGGGLGGLLGGLGSLFGSSGGAGAGSFMDAGTEVGGSVGFAHTGGNIESLSGRKVLPMALFANARRYHNGGNLLGPDEIPLIGRKGERMLNVAETQAYNRGGDSGAQPIVINFAPSTNVQGSDKDQIQSLIQQNNRVIAAQLPDIVIKTVRDANSRRVKLAS